MSKKLKKEELEFTYAELTELSRNRAFKALIEAIQDRMDDYARDLCIPSQTRDMEMVRTLQGELSGLKWTLDWIEIAERELKPEEKDNA